MSTPNLARTNDLSAFCFDFPTSGTLCFPEARQCTPYVVQETDTCVSIADSIGVGWNRLASWNPELGISCDNIEEHVGYVICTSNPGGPWIDPSPAPPETTADAS